MGRSDQEVGHDATFGPGDASPLDLLKVNSFLLLEINGAGCDKICDRNTNTVDKGAPFTDKKLSTVSVEIHFSRGCTMNNNNGNKGNANKPKKLTVDDLKKVIGGAVSPDAPIPLEFESEDLLQNKQTLKSGTTA